MVVGDDSVDYTIRQLAVLAGVSTRTLRYYDEIGLLKPKKYNASGYRIYGSNEVDNLLQILLYRQLDISLDEIKLIMLDPTFDSIKALENHFLKLIEKKEYLLSLIESVSQTIKSKKEGIEMSDYRKFKEIKTMNLLENENKYGQEIRKKYGDKTINNANDKYMNMSENKYNLAQKLEKDIIDYLNKAMDKNDYMTEDAKTVFDLHKEWISIYWHEYSSLKHRELADMYTDDDRFKGYYDSKRSGTAEFLKKIIYYFT